MEDTSDLTKIAKCIPYIDSKCTMADDILNNG